MELLNIKILNTAVERIMNREMSELGLTYAQASVIGFLIENQQENICQKDIEYRLGLTHPTVSSILNRMEANEMIRTEPLPSDHRYKRIILTEKASNLASEINKKYQNVKARLFEGISPAQRELMNATIQIILKNTE